MLTAALNRKKPSPHVTTFLKPHQYAFFNIYTMLPKHTGHNIY